MVFKNISNTNLMSLFWQKNNRKSDHLKMPIHLHWSKYSAHIQEWINLFLNKIQNQKFIIFEDDFDLENLNTEDLEKIKSFGNNWLIENINFFNAVEEININIDAYNIVEKLQLIGFRKKLNLSFELFFNFKNNNSEEEEEEKQFITIAFEVFRDTKDKFVSFINDELKSQTLRFREPNFYNKKNNYNEWNEVRLEFFWKIHFWSDCVVEISRDFINKINQKFLTNLTISNNLLFILWKPEINGKRVQLKFYYRRLDVQIIAYFEFSNFDETYFIRAFAMDYEKNTIRPYMERNVSTSKHFDYILKIEKNLLNVLDYFQQYLYIHEFLDEACQRIEKVWNFYFISLNLVARIDFQKNDFELSKLLAINFQESGWVDIGASFSTIQNNKFVRIFRIQW